MDITVELCSYPDLDDRIAIIRAADEVDSVFVRTERFNVLIDTLATPALCARALELLGGHLQDRPLVVVNSHMDWDHFWGNAALRGGVPIVAHAKALERLHDPSSRQTLSDKMQESARFHDVEIIAPNITFAGEEMALHGGDLTLELIHTPGHAPDHVSVWIPEIRVCLAVDAVETPIPEVWSKAPADLHALCSSLQRIRDLKANHVVLAHGQTSAPSVVDENLSYFAALRDRVAELADEHLADPALNERPGLRLQDFVNVPAAMPAETAVFYENCHKSNLRAAVEARKATFAFI
ncbi:MBL fold metallo-hydrolase [Rhizobium sp. NXC24]|uniref:MBL fold metallo-hydrolase n=1 Tax=Rhizobium sp. NXC24 TaxID=2048897 RepID=UPI000CDF4B4B|nr:MBL fold metallo-hydrolase [Rhizobium sp. NXC24]AVA26622.1 metallo-beta-lactamase family hydrolase protein [Rhizobium sp. NXC24]